MCPEINGALLLRRRRGPSAAMRNARGALNPVYGVHITLPCRAVGRDFNINNAINLKPYIRRANVCVRVCVLYVSMCASPRCLHCTGSNGVGRKRFGFQSFVTHPLGQGCSARCDDCGVDGREPDRTVADVAREPRLDAVAAAVGSGGDDTLSGCLIKTAVTKTKRK